jgi:hypothetical protein
VYWKHTGEHFSSTKHKQLAFYLDHFMKWSGRTLEGHDNTPALPYIFSNRLGRGMNVFDKTSFRPRVFVFFCVAKDGYFGPVLSSSEVGSDTAYMIREASVSMIMRAAHTGFCFSLITPAYFHGAMDGGAVVRSIGTIMSTKNPRLHLNHIEYGFSELRQLPFLKTLINFPRGSKFRTDFTWSE